MINTDIDTKGLERQIMSMAKDFGESNESAICRWGVATCRSLVKGTQAWGDGTEAKKKQEESIKKDANRAIYSVSKGTYVNGVASGKLSGLVINGQLVTFTPDRILKTPEEINAFIDRKQTSKRNRVPTMKRNEKGITSSAAMTKALRIRYKNSGKAKGAWIGAGLAIGAKQRKGSRLTIGKNVAGYAHKFKGGGTAQLIASQWNPIGKITNNIPYVSTDYVLKKSDATDAINTGGQMTVKWYESAMAAKLKRKTK
jgi:hypothetical protein